MQTMRKTGTKIFSWVLLLLLLTGLLTGCGTNDQENSADGQSVLRYGSGDYTAINPALSPPAMISCASDASASPTASVASSLAAALSVVSALLPHPASAAVPRTAAAVRIPAFLTVWNDFFIIVLSFPSRRSSCSCLQTCTVPLVCGFQSNIEPAANQLRFL